MAHATDNLHARPPFLSWARQVHIPPTGTFRDKASHETRRQVLLQLAADTAPGAYGPVYPIPAVDHLAATLGRSVQTIARALALLDDADLIVARPITRARTIRLRTPGSPERTITRRSR